MAPSPATLADRFRLARSTDVPALRTFFARQLDNGEEVFDAFNPFAHPIFGVCVPVADIWMVTVRRKVIAAGWFHLLQAGIVRVVALTDPHRDEFTEPLLAYIEAALQVIAYERRIVLSQIIAWLPEGPHRPRLASAYARRGWTYLELPWIALPERAQLRPGVLTRVLNEAESSGITVEAQSTPEASIGQADIDESNALLHFFRLGGEFVYGAVEHGQMVAINGVKAHAGLGHVLTTSALWITDSPQSALIERALAAAVLSHRPTLPDALVGSGEGSPYLEWFNGDIELERREGYMLAVDPAREPTHWEFALGFNPYRLWFVG